jgi:hypothetical protein
MIGAFCAIITVQCVPFTSNIAASNTPVTMSVERVGTLPNGCQMNAVTK